MREGNALQVFYDEKLVGTLAMTADRKAAFQYSEEWIENGFPISPFSLPLKKQVFVPTKDYFDGLFGVFADSLPDNWGRLLLDRLLRAHKQNPDKLTVLDRLAIVGKSGMGALTYYPEKKIDEQYGDVDLDELAEQCRKILNTEYSDRLDELYRLGGTSGGARPKIMTTVNGEEWIIKFPAHVDGENAGKMEYDYSCCAKKCGIIMSETRLFPSENCEGYFGIKRFDRISDKNGTKRIHMLTAAALLELNFEQPSLDYHSLMKLTKILTRDNEKDMREMFRRMCFNVFAHNRDDHSKNFTYLYDDEKDRWSLSPAYDLTYSNTYYGEHTTTVDGNGRNPGRKELLTVGIAAGMKKEVCIESMDMVEKCVKNMLGDIFKEIDMWNNLLLGGQKMTIRKAEEKDILRIIELLGQVLQIHADIRPDIFIPGTTKYTVSELTELLEKEEKPIYVAVNEEDVCVGYAFCQLQEQPFSTNMVPFKSLFIDDLCVDQHARGQHIGESLFEYVKNEAKRMGCYEVTLNVWAGNTSAEKFYEKMGMKTKERQMEYILEH